MLHMYTAFSTYCDLIFFSNLLLLYSQILISICNAARSFILQRMQVYRGGKALHHQPPWQHVSPHSFHQSCTWLLFEDPLSDTVDGSQFLAECIQVLSHGAELGRSRPQLVASGHVLHRLAHFGQQGQTLTLVQILQTAHMMSTVICMLRKPHSCFYSILLPSLFHHLFYMVDFCTVLVCYFLFLSPIILLLRQPHFPTGINKVLSSVSAT